MNEVIILLLALGFCHWMADFTHLSTDWMLNAKRYGKPLYPILMHALVHAILFFVAVFIITNDFYKAAMAFGIQWPTHFIIDLLKGKIQWHFKSLNDPTNKFHWWLFGFDQFLHFTVIVTIVRFCVI
ncbi:MAG: DUF3307 domain-containing protein [Bacteroidia bacterium]